MSAELLALPRQPDAVPWPTLVWPAGAPPEHATDTMESVTEALFARSRKSEFGDTHALVVIHGGRVVAERYARGTTALSPLLSWSMAKSVLDTLVGILIERGELDLDAPAPVTAWADDERREITLRQLLTFTDGLAWAEDYVDDQASDVIEMLFGNGADDVAGYAAARPLLHTPGEAFNYSSGTSNIVSAIVRDVVGADHYEGLLREEVLEPIGIRDAVLRFDTAGTWIASSFLWCTARDYARFGLVYLRGGQWDGCRIVPTEWVDFARTHTATEAPEDGGRSHGAHWWIWPDDSHGAFYAGGYENQRIIVVPALDVVVVKLGKTDISIAPNADRELSRLIRAFAVRAD